MLASSILRPGGARPRGFRVLRFGFFRGKSYAVSGMRTKGGAGWAWTRALRVHSLSLGGAALLCLTLGLAPFAPEPHILKQIRNIANHTLTEPLDLFDLVIHGVPFVVLVLVLVRVVKDARSWSVLAAAGGALGEGDNKESLP